MMRTRQPSNDIVGQRDAHGRGRRACRVCRARVPRGSRHEGVVARHVDNARHRVVELLFGSLLTVAGQPVQLVSGRGVRARVHIFDFSRLLSARAERERSRPSKSAMAQASASTSLASASKHPTCVRAVSANARLTNPSTSSSDATAGSREIGDLPASAARSAPNWCVRGGSHISDRCTNANEPWIDFV